jgi:hypothetical protein
MGRGDPVDAATSLSLGRISERPALIGNFNPFCKSAETRSGRSNPAPASGDAMAEAFRRAGLAGKTPGRQ